MDDSSVWQWLAGIIVGGWLTVQTAVTSRMFKKLDDLDAKKANKDHIDNRIYELSGKVEAHDIRNANSHAKIFEGNAEIRERLARIEEKVDTIRNHGGVP